MGKPGSAGGRIVLGWGTEADHRAFRKQITAHLKSAGLRRPINVERLTIAKLGWTEPGGSGVSG